mgnify:CR=1 FL=1
MFKLIDLSHPIDEQTPTYPGDSPVRLLKTKFFTKDGFTDYQLETGMHSGTHLDGSMHLTEQIKSISEIPLESFYSEGCLLDVRGEPQIGMKEQYRSQVKEGSIILFYTGWDQKYGDQSIFSASLRSNPN